MTEYPRGDDPGTLPEDPWPDSPYPPLEVTPAGNPRVPWWVISVGLVTAVLAIASFVVVLAWPSGSEEEVPEAAFAFRPREEVRQIRYPEPSENAFTQVVGDRAYVAWQHGDDLDLVAVDLDRDTDRTVDAWEGTVTGDPERYWSWLLASPEVVVAADYPDEPDEDEDEEEPEPEPLTMVVLSADDGDRLWEREIHAEDDVWVTGDTLVQVDRALHAVRGLDATTGRERWRVSFEGSFEEGPDGGATVVPVLRAEHVSGPSTVDGLSVDPQVERLVLVDEDRTVRVVDIQDGTVVEEGTNIAHPEDVVLAYEDRLFVAFAAHGYRVDQRDLGDLSRQPRTVYITPDPLRRPTALSPCGGGPPLPARPGGVGVDHHRGTGDRAGPGRPAYW